MSVLAIGSQGCKRSKQLDARADDRLMHPSPMVWERSRNIIRRPQVRAPPSRLTVHHRGNAYVKWPHMKMATELLQEAKALLEKLSGTQAGPTGR